MVKENLFADFYNGRKVFITGHTGFKGSWLLYALYRAGAIIKGYALAPETNPSLYNLIEKTTSVQSVIADIRDSLRLEQEIVNFQPDFIFHLAAQPLVRKSYKEPLSTFSTNVMGTANVLNAITRIEKSCSVILITTDKVYQNKEADYMYRETDRLGGYDPYSASKACAELVINSYHQSFFNPANLDKHKKAIASVRAGNVIGGGDWAEDRLIPDVIRSLIENKDINIRNPNSVRPWQHVLESVFGYLKLGSLLFSDSFKYGGAWNFGPDVSDNIPVLNIAEQAIGIWGKGNINIQTARNDLHEAGLLKLDITKAINELAWRPKMNTETAIDRTIKWYKSFYEREATAVELMEADISYYKSL